MAIHPGIAIELHSFTTSNDIDLIKMDFDLYFTDNDMTDSHLSPHAGIIAINLRK